MNRRNLVVSGVVLAVVGALGLRVWWYWPEELHAGPHVHKMERRGRDYSVHIKQGASLSDVVNLQIFEGYSPSNSSEFRERIESRPSKHVREHDYHSYDEYVAQHGRMRFHFGLGGDGIYEFFEFLPSDLPVDKFLKPEIAINLDLTVPEFKVYIQHKREHTHMGIVVKSRKIDSIGWD